MTKTVSTLLVFVCLFCLLSPSEFYSLLHTRDSSFLPQLSLPAHFVNKKSSITWKEAITCNYNYLVWFFCGAGLFCPHNFDVCPQSRWILSSNVENPFQICPCHIWHQFCYFITRGKDPAQARFWPWLCMGEGYQLRSCYIVWTSHYACEPQKLFLKSDSVP